MKLKRIIIVISGIAIFIFITVFFAIIFPFLGTKKIPDSTDFARGRITAVADGMSQVYILNGGDGKMGLIDAGNSPDGKPVIEALASMGFNSSDVKSIFLTHGHPDHIAAAKIFTNAKIYSLQEEVEIAEGTGNNSSPIGYIFKASPTGLKVTDILKDSDAISFGSLKIEVFSIPGHTNGSAAYLIDGVLFMGDAALSSSDGKIRQAVWIFSNDVEQQNRSLKSLALKLQPRKNEIKNIVFSHSGELDGLQPLIDFAETIH